MELSKAQRELFCMYMKPFNKKLMPPLTRPNDGKYISSGNYSGSNVSCPHEYCMAEMRRYYGLTELMDSQPVGLPWASGLLKHLPGHVKVKFPLRKKKPGRKRPPKKQGPPPPPPDLITNHKVCGGLDEMIYAYKVFMLAGMVISEAKREIAEKEEEEAKKEEEEAEKKEEESKEKEKEGKKAEEENTKKKK